MPNKINGICDSFIENSFFKKMKITRYAHDVEIILILKNIGIKVDEKAIQSIEKLDGTAVIALNGTALVRVVDEKMLIDQAEKFIDPLSEFSLNSKIYTAEAVKPELLYTQEIMTTYSKAKAARVVARENLAAIEASPEATKEEIQAAEAVVYTTKLSEIAAGQSLVSNSEMASATAQQATLENLRAIASTPGMNKFDVRRANAAIKSAEAAIAASKIFPPLSIAYFAALVVPTPCVEIMKFLA